MNLKFPHPFGQIAERYRIMRRHLPIVVANMAVNEFKNNFRVGGYDTNAGVQRWKERKKEEKSKRALLVKSGRLRRSLRPSATFDYAIVTSNIPYAQIHNEGGKITGTATVSAYRKKNGTRVTGHTKQLNTVIPARPFMITTDKLLDKVSAHVEAEVGKIFEA